MHQRATIALSCLSLFVLLNAACRENLSATPSATLTGASANMPDPIASEGETPVQKSNDDWKQELSDEQFRVLRQCGTEPPFTGKYWDHHEKGVYHCAACGKPLFSSETKFDSGSGWPSFWNPASNDALRARVDESHGMVRTEILCAGCGGHLGHVFEDGPQPTGLRYCINSAALEFREDKSE
jgi:peptide-methionine (R)-S-oxide reductase